jgi:AraC-like DNA-binding protein
MNIFNHENIATYIILLTGGVSLLISIGELLVRNRRTENYIFGALLFSFGILVFQNWFIAEGIVLNYPHLFCFHVTFLYFIGPIGYFAYFLTILPSDMLPIKMIVYLVPSLIAILFDIYYILMPPDMQRALLELLFYSGPIWQNMPVRILMVRILIAAAGLQLFVYFGFLLFRFLMIWIKEGHALVLLISMAYLVYTIVTAELVYAGHVLPSPGLLKWGCFMISFVLLSAFLVSQRLPRLLQLIMEESKKRYSAQSRLTGIDLDRVIRDLKYCMDEKEMFLDDKLTLKDLANELSITSHQLSQLLNERLSTNFNNYVNLHRIENAKKLLLNEPDRSVISIAYSVGFNTKSAFYNAFSRFTGKNPLDFRKENM